MRAAERIESLKAGGLAAIVFTGTYCFFILANHFLITQSLFESNGLISIATTLLSGLLFGITYRHLIRVEDNSHLKDGAVLAFGLVRGLVPLEMSRSALEMGLLLSAFAAESLVCFAVARLSLDMALKWKWI